MKTTGLYNIIYIYITKSTLKRSHVKGILNIVVSVTVFKFSCNETGRILHVMEDFLPKLCVVKAKAIWKVRSNNWPSHKFTVNIDFDNNVL